MEPTKAFCYVKYLAFCYFRPVKIKLIVFLGLEDFKFCICCKPVLNKKLYWCKELCLSFWKYGFQILQEKLAWLLTFLEDLLI